MRNLTPVILQAGLKEALTEGGIVEALCVEDAKKVLNVWQGTWRIQLRFSMSGKAPGASSCALATRRPFW